MVPAELVTVTLAVAGVELVSVHCAGVLDALDSAAELPPTVTVDPTSCSAEVASDVCCRLMRLCRLVFVLICCSTEANSTNCWVN